MSEQRHIYAGVARWRGGSDHSGDPAAPGGVFRLAVGEAEWQHMDRGMPEGPHCHAVTVDPHDGATVYAGMHDGPYRSTDRGGHWERLGFPRNGAQVWSVAVHPRDRNTLLVGTSPLGIWRSTDAGASWQQGAGSTPPDRIAMGQFRNRIMRFAFDPADPATVYAAMEVNGVLRSRDGGETWQDCSDHLVKLSSQAGLRSAILTSSESEGMLDAHAIAVSAASRSPFLAVRMGIFRSDDGAAHWENLGVGRFSPITYGRDIQVSPHDPRMLFACLSVAASSDHGRIYRSADLGESWQRFDEGCDAHSTMMAVAPHPRDAKVVYGAARKGEVFGTEDGGRTWRCVPLPASVVGVYGLAAG